jgi:hypothetical protein
MNQILTPQLVLARGDDYQWGRMVGEAEQDRIQAAQKILSELPIFRIHQPWWLPYQLYVYWAESIARGVLEHVMSRAFPRLTNRLKGMAEGAGVRPETLFLFHMLEGACNQHCDEQGMNVPPPGGCTAVAFGPERTSRHEPVLLHNLDQVSQAVPFLTVRKSRAEGDLCSIVLTLSPLCGVVDGMNEVGLCISYNYAAAIEVAGEGTPVSLAISDALSQCRTVSEAVERITRRLRSHGAMLMLADATGAAARLELSGHHHHLELLADPAGVLFHTNSYRSETMLPRQVAGTALYGETCPAPLRGVRILESSECRDRRLGELVAAQQHSNIEEISSILHDHGCQGSAEPGPNTICMHGEYWSTIASVRMLPRSRVISVSYGPACEAKFRDFAF